MLSFRGSRTMSNWIADISTALIPSSLCSGCEVHQGFWDDYQTVASTLKTQIDTAQKSYPGYALVVTGHSLGGALAMLCGTDLHNQGYTPTIVRNSYFRYSLIFTLRYTPVMAFSGADLKLLTVVDTCSIHTASHA